MAGRLTCRWCGESLIREAIYRSTDDEFLGEFWVTRTALTPIGTTVCMRRLGSRERVDRIAAGLPHDDSHEPLDVPDALDPDNVRSWLET